MGLLEVLLNHWWFCFFFLVFFFLGFGGALGGFVRTFFTLLGFFVELWGVLSGALGDIVTFGIGGSLSRVRGRNEDFLATLLVWFSFGVMTFSCFFWTGDFGEAGGCRCFHNALLMVYYSTGFLLFGADSSEFIVASAGVFVLILCMNTRGGSCTTSFACLTRFYVILYAPHGFCMLFCWCYRSPSAKMTSGGPSSFNKSWEVKHFRCLFLSCMLSEAAHSLLYSLLQVDSSFSMTSPRQISC